MLLKKFIRFIWYITPKVDFVLFLFVYPAAFLLKYVRIVGIHRLPLCKKALLQIGIFPIRDHYDEPLFNPKHLVHPVSENRILPGIDWNVSEQLNVLNEFSYNNELRTIPRSQTDQQNFYMENVSFTFGDAEYWYNLIRWRKPERIFEIGSGYSTLMAMKAIKKNEEDVPGYKCKHICIEPYKRPWLETVGAAVIRKKVENIEKEFFSQLGENDILFIDSSHIIRPQGDVVFEYLEVLPTLNKGVIVHIHDIFSPREEDYWAKGKVKFVNEQYLLEAFLTSNPDWKIIGALNYLQHNYYEELKARCPFLTPDREPSSFYIQKIG
jgi:hypothetical protein